MSSTRKRRRRGPWLLLIFMLLGASAALITWAYSRLKIDQQLIQAERYQNRAFFRLGLPLPGTPDLARLDERVQAHGVRLGAPIFMRIFKREFELELWLLRDGRFHRFAAYPICRWSGDLGPKLQEGDRQAPEGFYTVDKSALNPNSRWHRSFNLGFPNLFDRSFGRTGSFLMVHGGCSSIGCFAMTDPVIDEIWKIITAAFDAGQPRFHVQIFPFRMSDENLKRYEDSSLTPFWYNLKQGHDLFEADWFPPEVSACNGHYEFRAASTKDGSDPIIARCPPT